MMRVLSISLFILAGVSLIKGFHKMFVYENPDSYLLDIKNAYVGSDAYNYVINGTYSTAFFVLFGALLISGILVEMVIAINRLKNEGINTELVEDTTTHV